MTLTLRPMQRRTTAEALEALQAYDDLDAYSLLLFQRASLNVPGAA
jgi:hypothetical protein